jgi:hypothetical protein
MNGELTKKLYYASAELRNVAEKLSKGEFAPGTKTVRLDEGTVRDFILFFGRMARS